MSKEFSLEKYINDLEANPKPFYDFSPKPQAILVYREEEYPIIQLFYHDVYREVLVSKGIDKEALLKLKKIRNRKEYDKALLAYNAILNTVSIPNGFKGCLYMNVANCDKLSMLMYKDGIIGNMLISHPHEKGHLIFTIVNIQKNAKKDCKDSDIAKLEFHASHAQLVE